MLKHLTIKGVIKNIAKWTFHSPLTKKYSGVKYARRKFNLKHHVCPNKVQDEIEDNTASLQQGCFSTS